ncbi:MAG TPA: hypothetical protein VIA18_03515, partial [Polyangia bacterium]|nr:hypothetical protein [Polyangia bacterium]
MRSVSRTRKWAVASSAAAVVCGVSWIAVGRGPAPSPLAAPASKLTPATDQKRATGGELAPVPGGMPEAEGDIPFVSARADAVTTPSAADAWGGPRTGQEATLSDRVVKYEIATTLDPKAHTLEGQEKMTWRNRSNRPVKSIYLHLYLNAFEGP